MDNITKKLKIFFLELLFPSFCLGCKKEGTYLCGDCKATLEISEFNYCLCSKNPLRFPAGSRAGKCSRCQDKALAGLYFALPYKEKFLTRKIIFQFKYPPYVKELAKVLANILATHLVLAQNIDKEIWHNAVFIPVPLEKSKLKERGYNQAEAVAKQLATLFPIPVMAGNLIKIKKTKQQKTLSGKERQENNKGAFAIKNPALLAGKKVFLVDDVYTTGSTMAECANVLRTYGAKQVWGIALTREG